MYKVFICFLLYVELMATSTDLKSVLELTRVQSRGGEVLLACTPRASHVIVSNLEWKCRGCFQKSQYKDLTLATKEGIVKNHKNLNQRFQIVRVGNSYSLNIKGAKPSDSGKYFCLINNSSKPQVLHNLAIQDVAGPPGKPLVMSFDSRSVKLSWTPPRNTNHAPVTHYTIQILEGERDDWSDYTSINTQYAELSYRVTDLNPFTVYSFRVVAINRMGASEPSEPSYFMSTARELPTGKVQFSETYSKDPHSIQVSWMTPNKESINGEFLGYRISWKVRNERLDRSKENSTDIKDPNLNKFTFTSLEPYTSYLISIQIVNPVGAGPRSTVLISTQAGVASGPANLTVVNIESTAVTLTWEKPSSPNGKIKGYRVYYNRDMYNEINVINTTAEHIIYNLTNLVPYTKYEIFVTAFTDIREGNQSTIVKVLTDVSGPAAPEISNLSCPSDTEVYIQWSSQQGYKSAVDKYKIYYKQRETGSGWNVQERNVINLPKYGSIQDQVLLLTNLSREEEYTIFIQSLRESIYTRNKYIPGNSTEVIKITPGRDCDKIQVSPMREEGSGSNVLFACLLGTVFIIITILLLSVAVVCRKRLLYSDDDNLSELHNVNSVQTVHTALSQQFPQWSIASSYTLGNLSNDLSVQSFWDLDPDTPTSEDTSLQVRRQWSSSPGLVEYLRTQEQPHEQDYHALHHGLPDNLMSFQDNFTQFPRCQGSMEYLQNPSFLPRENFFKVQLSSFGPNFNTHQNGKICMSRSQVQFKVPQTHMLEVIQDEDEDEDTEKVSLEMEGITDDRLDTNRLESFQGSDTEAQPGSGRDGGGGEAQAVISFRNGDNGGQAVSFRAADVDSQAVSFHNGETDRRCVGFRDVETRALVNRDESSSSSSTDTTDKYSEEYNQIADETTRAIFPPLNALDADGNPVRTIGSSECLRVNISQSLETDL